MKQFFKRVLGLGEPVEMKNRAVVECLRELEFPPEKIRLALLHLNAVRIRKFVNGSASPSLVYATIKGSRKDPKVQEQVAAEFGLRVEEIFPEQRHSGSGL